MQKKAAKEAGHVIKATEDLKKRDANSLIWEKAKATDILYYQDSVLTLSQSTATLYLKDQTELQLSENTLVTLEEPEDKSKSEIRLRFAKGDLKARNPFAKSKIEGEDWVVNLEKGAEVSLRKDAENYEFEVLTGKASLQTAAGEEHLTDSKIIKFGEDKKIESIEKSSELKWQEEKPVRIYTYTDTAKVSLNWQGQAKNLQINRQGAEEKTQKLKSEQKNAEIKLEVGSYKVRLKDDKGLSNSKVVEVWKAPRIYLKKPLPRDRIKIGTPQEFIWAGDNRVKKYKLKLGQQEEIELDDNFKAVTFDQEQDLVWKVEAEDEEGFSIPSIYENKVFLRKDPLAAPKLKTPNIEENEHDSNKSEETKKPNGAWLNKLKLFRILLLNVVEAQERPKYKRRDIVFEWEPVDGADLYTIEISSDPEFYNPEVVQTLRQTRFVWKGFKENVKYYWRVASGSTFGRMGLFSEPIEVQPVKILKKTESAKAEVKVFEEAEKPKAEEEVKPKVEAQPILQPAEKIFQPYSRWSFAWTPAYKFIDVKGTLNSSVKLNGAAPLFFAVKNKSNYGSEYDYLYSLFAGSQIWKPEDNPTSQQDDLQISEVWLRAERQQVESSWRYGLAVHQSFLTERVNAAAVVSAQKWLPGLIAGWSQENVSYALFALVAGDVSELGLEMDYKYYLDEQHKLFIGLNPSVVQQINENGSGILGNFKISFGLDAF